jgi:hypothetical protein
VVPRTIDILGRTYKIRRRRMKYYGLLDDDLQIIWLKSGVKGDMASKTVLHEVIHAILFSSGSKYQLSPGQEESIVRALEHGLWQAGYRHPVES